MLAAHYSNKAKAFLKTVVCFDDEPADAGGASIREPLIAKRADSGFGDDEPPQRVDSSIKQQSESEEESHPLDFRATASAFAEQGILCSVLQPIQIGASFVNRIATLANAADVTILDWELEGRKVRGSEACRSAVKEILEQDRVIGGRLRLIVIYTGTDGMRAVEDLEVELVEFGVKRDDDGIALTGKHWRLVVFQKPLTTNPTARLVNYPELPGLVVDEFSKLTNGLLPSAVLHGITAIRESAHRLLAVFDSELDGAFLTHRALIPEPSDAEEFLLGLIQDEIGELIRRDGFGECVDASKCKSWIQERKVCEEEPKKKARLIKYISEPNRSKTDGFTKDFFPNEQEASRGDIADAVLLALHSGELDKATGGSNRFVELTNFYKTGTVPSSSNLWLRLGTIVWDRKSDNYLLCLQPLCDAARISKASLFPFLILDIISETDKKMSRDFFVRSVEGKDIWLQADSSPKKLVSHCFDPSERSGVAPIMGVEDKDNAGRFVFMTSARENKLNLVWIGDVKLGKAQRIASSLAARFHTLGIDEFEWQRLHQ